MKNTNQNWKGLTEDLFNPHLFCETLFGDDQADDTQSDFASDHMTIEEMDYRDFVQLVNVEKKMRKNRKTTGSPKN